MKLKPVYFENQKQCASALGLDESELKEWKAENCPAFQYGRIYHAPLLEWIVRKRERARERQCDADSDDDEIVSDSDWMHRRSVLFEVLAFLHDAYLDKRIDLVKYEQLGTATVEQMIQLGEVWGAGIDAPGWRKTWKACVAEAILKKEQENIARREV